MTRFIRDNVERIADTEEQALKLESAGFKKLLKSRKSSSKKSKDDDNDEEKSLSEMTEKELQKLAKERGIDVPASLDKSDLIKILETGTDKSESSGDDE